MKHQEPPKEEIEIETLHYNADETCSAVVPDFEAIPAADVAEVVHCKNCRYWDGYNHSGRCEAPVNGLVRENTNANDFCSYGERKEG